MKKRKIAILAIVGLLLVAQLLGGCGAQEKEPAWYQGIVDDLRAIQPYEVPEHLQEEDCNKNGTEFDVNEYFGVLTNLSVEPGYALDYVYLFEWAGGRPLLYVRADNREPFSNYEEYYLGIMYQEGIDDAQGIVTPLWNDESGAFEDKIHIDGTKEGFFQYAVLQVVGTQFYLWWHANYNDWRIICEPGRIDEIVAGVLSSGYQEGIPPDFAEKARALDCKPIIELKDDTATVSILIFTDWGGFKRLMFEIKRDYPHTIVNFQIETLVEYDCGIMF
ncbi:MAG: hypothetical protein A2Y89_05905 [Chloroflexi bacterium RBG_13_51_18]|nr:MAG: hypothetical protein A2Y89_05905 [Chloroflexi bacterium RBG_13_51_18]